LKKYEWAAYAIIFILICSVGSGRVTPFMLVAIIAIAWWVGKEKKDVNKD